MIVLGLGGNVGTDAEIVARFRAARDQIDGPMRSAPLYRSAAIGPEQPPFLNTALAFPAELPLEHVLSLVQSIELAHGRVRRERWGPRTLDIDILVAGDRVSATPELTVPHPRLAERRFALQPLIDLVGGDFEIPRIGRAADALVRVRDQDVQLIAEDW